MIAMKVFCFINYIHKQDENKILNVYTNPDNFFTKLYQVVLATHNIWINLKKYILYKSINE